MWYPSLEFIEPFREFKFCDLFECYFWFFHSKLKHNFCSDLTSKQYWFQNNIVKFESLHKSRVLKSSVHFSILCCSPKWNLFKLLLELTFFWLVGTTCYRILPIKFLEMSLPFCMCTFSLSLSLSLIWISASLYIYTHIWFKIVTLVYLHTITYTANIIVFLVRGYSEIQTSWVCIGDFGLHLSISLQRNTLMLFSGQSFFSMYCVGRSNTDGNFEHRNVPHGGKRKQPVEFVLVVWTDFMLCLLYI